MLDMSYPLDEPNSSSKQNVTQLRKLFTDPKCDPDEATKEWVQHASMAELRSNRMELKLLLGLLERMSFPIPPRLQAYQTYYQGLLHEIDAEYPKSEEYYRQGLELAQKLPDAELLIAIFERGLANNLAHRGEPKEALKLFLSALEIAQREGHKQTIANSLRGLSFCYYKLGEVIASKEYAEKALEIARQTNNLPVEASAYNNLALCYIATDRLEEGRLALEKVIILRQSLGQSRELGIVYLNLGLVHEKLGEIKAAIDTAQMALTLASQANNQPIMGLAYINLTLYYNQQNEPAKALAMSSRAIDLYKDNSDKNYLAAALIAKAASYGLLGKREQTLGLLAEAEALLEQVRDKSNKSVLASLYSNLSEAILYVAVSPEDYQKAFSYRNESLAIFEQINDNYSITRMLELEATILLKPQHKYKYRKIALQSLQKWWNCLQKLPTNEPLKHLDTMLILAELLGEEGAKEQGFEMYNQVFAQLKSGKLNLDKRKLAEHYAKAAKLTGPDKALPLVEYALELFKADNSDMVRIKELTNEIAALRKQVKGKWFSGKN